MPGQCSALQTPAELSSHPSRKRPLYPELNRVAQKHCKTDDQDALGMVVAPSSLPGAIEHKFGTGGALTRLSGLEPPLLPSDSLQEQNVLPYCKGTTGFFEYGSRDQSQSVVGHGTIPHALLDRAHVEFQETSPRYLDRYSNSGGFLGRPKDFRAAKLSPLVGRLSGESDENVLVAADDFDTPLASIPFPQAMTPQHPEHVVEADSDDVIKLLSDAMSSTSIHDAHDAQSQAAASEPKTLSSMSSIYGSKSLYQAKKRRSSQCTKSSLPEMRTFDTTIDTMLCEAAHQEPLHNPHEVLEFYTPPHLDNREALLESAMSGNVLQIVGLMSDFRGCIDINHISPASNGQTPLMVVIRKSGTLFSELLMQCIMTPQWPLLSTTDYDGNSIIDLATLDGTELVVTRFIERMTAVMCCDCPDQERRGSLCEWIAHTAPSERCGLVLEGGPVRYPFRTECQWGERLLRHDWLTVETLQEIDDWMGARIYRINSSHRVRMANELRGMCWKPDEWNIGLP